MPPSRSRTGCLLLAIVAAAVATVCAAAVLAMPGTVATLGEPAADLSDMERMLLGIYLVMNRSELGSPSGSPEQTATLEVEPGQDASSVVAELTSLGIVDDPILLTRYLRFRGLDTGIEAGSYPVSGSMSPVELAELLQLAVASRYTLTIPEGWRREEIAEALGGLGLEFGASEFLAATTPAPPPFVEPPEGAAGLEGFLFPDTYRLDPRMTAEEVVGLMLDNFEARSEAPLLDGFAAVGLTPFEAVTLASVVEREAAVPAERPLIASVFLNRLALGIPLQADPTVQYALGRQPDGGWWKAPLTEADLAIDSPYNTYRYPGLPPGPISNPGLDSLRAVADPAETAYLFFRTACGGSGAHVFATTFEEHVANACP